MPEGTEVFCLLLEAEDADDTQPSKDFDETPRGEDDDEERTCPSCGAVVGDPCEIDCSSASWPEVVDEEDEPHEIGCDCADCEVTRG